MGGRARERAATHALRAASAQSTRRASAGVDRAQRRDASASAAARRQAILQAGIRQASRAADSGTEAVQREQTSAARLGRTLASERLAVSAQRLAGRWASAPGSVATLTGASSAPTTTATLSQFPVTSAGFSGPASWTGASLTVPALAGVVRSQAGSVLDGDGPPAFLIPIYIEAGRRYHVPWQVLAAINSVETDYGRNLNTSSAGAIGWMQFEPSTWRRYAVAADGHSVANPYDPRDAIFAAARYLQAAGAEDDLRGAIYSYNHAGWYVDEVMGRADAIAARRQYAQLSTNRAGTVTADFATRDPELTRIRFRGGVLSHYDRLITTANMVSAADFPYLWGGGHEQPARFGPFDCSGSVSYVMQQAGFQVPTSVAGNIGGWGLPRGPGQVTIFYNDVHTFMRIGDRYFGTSGFARPGGGAGWFDTARLPESYLAEFNEVHLPGLGRNSFAAGQRAIVIPKLTPRERQHEAEVSAAAGAEQARQSVTADAARADRTFAAITDALRTRFESFPQGFSAR